MTRVGVLLSGRGSNFVAIAEAEIDGVEIVLVVANREDAGGLAEARARGIRAVAIASAGRRREEHEREMVEALREAGVELVCLAGYMRVLTAWFVGAFPGGILNIHPSLLPSFAGLGVQGAALGYGVKVAGCTVHFVDEAVDHGVIVVQRTVAVEDEDTAETLAAKILVEEHLAYPEAIRRVVSGEYGVVGRRYVRMSQ